MMLNIQNIEKKDENLLFVGDFLESELLKTTEKYYEIKKDTEILKDSIIKGLNIVFLLAMVSTGVLGTSLFLSGFSLVIANIFLNIAGMSFFAIPFNDLFFKSKNLQSILSFFNKEKVEKYNRLNNDLLEIESNLKEKLEAPETIFYLVKILTMTSQNSEHKHIEQTLKRIVKNYIEKDFNKVFENFVDILGDIKNYLKNDYDIAKYVSSVLNGPFPMIEKKSAEVKFLEIYKKKQKYNK